ncbi:Zinc finger MYM-type protein 1 [Amphibalanus amphitrite]|uniref:Zinc finger MYM-type protein 1 n=1 Tax=Amphibalanus amphitrite TaxID=1232801 RepID=A0A6A4WLY1_AMPAM|nr:Zinc finger MYM-type protein 1 [Amphibalanus amphitrite]
MDTPNQPPGKSIPKQDLGGRKLSFMDHWYTLHPWIHFCPTRGKVLCFHCARANALSSSVPAKEKAFITEGFSNWKKALQRFSQHARSEHHLRSLPPSRNSITGVIETADAKQQEVNRANLMKVITSIIYLARQGLALRGHGNDDGNLIELLKLRACDSEELEQWLRRKERYLHQDTQNEILQLVSHEVLRNIISGMRDAVDGEVPDVPPFSVIVDGTQDISGNEQQSICVRYVDKDFNVQEEFLGFYQAQSTTGADLSRLIEDALRRLNLPLTHLRGLAFDGAANMAGCVRGVQAILREKTTKALFVHCGAHCVNLAAKESCDVSTMLRNALYTINEVGRLFAESLKFREKFAELCVCENESPKKLRPLCPTRWTVRLQAVDAALDRYDEVLSTVEELGAGRTHVAARAAGLHAQLRKKSTLLALHMARVVLAPLDRLNRAAQGSRCTVSQLMSSVRLTKELLQAERDNADHTIQGLLRKVEASSCDAPMTLPRQKRVPARFAGAGEQHHAEDLPQYLREQLLLAIDSACTQLSDRFDQEGVREHGKVEKALLSSLNVKELDQLFQESPWREDISVADLAPQLQVLFKNNRPENLDAAKATVADLEESARAMFPDAVKLVRLLLTLPASSATAERSFSANVRNLHADSEFGNSGKSFICAAERTSDS